MYLHVSFKLVASHHDPQDLEDFTRWPFFLSPIIPSLPHHHRLMASRNPKYDYQKQFVWCTCTECVAASGKKGQQVKQYTQWKHLEKDKLVALRNKIKQPELLVVPFNKMTAFKRAWLCQSEAQAGPSNWTCLVCTVLYNGWFLWNVFSPVRMSRTTFGLWSHPPVWCKAATESELPLAVWFILWDLGKVVQIKKDCAIHNVKQGLQW
jgi:hypothetical protein